MRVSLPCFRNVSKIVEEIPKYVGGHVLWYAIIIT
jgi:hypothetical protein